MSRRKCRQHRVAFGSAKANVSIAKAILASRNSAEPHHRKILDSTTAILFLGTPHSGSPSLAAWAEGLARAIGMFKQTNPQILRVLKQDSEVLERIQTEFHAMIRIRADHPIHITCCYEELPLPGVGEVSFCSYVTSRHQ